MDKLDELLRFRGVECDLHCLPVANSSGTLVMPLGRTVLIPFVGREKGKKRQVRIAELAPGASHSEKTGVPRAPSPAHPRTSRTSHSNSRVFYVLDSKPYLSN